jgi:HEAT repeat protein
MFDPSEVVRHAAADALGELGELSVLPLLEALDDEGEDARSWIALALDAVGADAIEDVLARSADGSALDREHIVEALGWLAEDRATAS